MVLAAVIAVEPAPGRRAVNLANGVVRVQPFLDVEQECVFQAFDPSSGIFQAAIEIFFTRKKMRLIAPDLDTVGRSINQGSPSPSPLQSESSDWMRAAAPFGRADYSV